VPRDRTIGSFSLSPRNPVTMRKTVTGIGRVGGNYCGERLGKPQPPENHAGRYKGLTHPYPVRKFGLDTVSVLIRLIGTTNGPRRAL
jgi:hypothetical protein